MLEIKKIKNKTYYAIIAHAADTNLSKDTEIGKIFFNSMKEKWVLQMEAGFALDSKDIDYIKAYIVNLIRERGEGGCI